MVFDIKICHWQGKSKLPEFPHAELGLVFESDPTEIGRLMGHLFEKGYNVMLHRSDIGPAILWVDEGRFGHG